MGFRENKKLWTRIKRVYGELEIDLKTLPTRKDTGEYCFIHNIHNDVCYRAIWQDGNKYWISPDFGDGDEWFPLIDVDMWMLAPIPYPTKSSKYASE